MSKVLIMSRTFPGYHLREGEETHFVEKYLNQRMGSHWKTPMYLQELADLNPTKPFSLIEKFYYSLDFTVTDTKGHTIRAGHLWKQGGFFSPRVWSGRPYHSPQIIFAPDTEVKKIWEFGIHDATTYINYNTVHFMGGYERLAQNDGLFLNDFLDWFQFPKPFSGQIIAWDERVKY